jgi:PAS domain S-box-containing protein
MTFEPWTIVIIDDNAEDRAEIRRCLLAGSERRYRFIEAETGAKGVRACLDAPPLRIDCVMLDYRLPDVTAFEVLAELASDDAGPRFPVVVLTGDVAHDRARALIRAGAQEYLGKGSMSEESLPRAVDNAIEHWKMARELRASEERLVRAQRAAHIGTWDWDIVSGIANWTEEAWRLFGREPFSAPVDYDYFLESLHPDDRARAVAAIELAKQTGRYHAEFRVLKADGTVRWLDLRGELLFDRERRPLRMLGTVQDLTERKRSADSLRAREQRLRLALRAGGTGVWSWEIASGRMVWSEEAYAIAGVAPSAFDGSFETFERLVHPADRERVLQDIQTCVADGGEYANEFRIVRPDGAIRLVTNLGLVERGEDGRPASMVGTITDVTEQRAAQAKLRERERQLQAVADNTPDILARFDRDMRHVFVNAAAERATGVAVASFLGKTNRELGMATPLCDQWEAAIARVFRTRLPFSYEFQFTGQAGQIQHYAARLVPEFDPAGSLEHVLCVSHDVTARKLAEDLLREADRRKDVFLATLAHELRNPLAPIRTGLELLKLSNDPESQARTIARMDRQVAQMVHLIDDLMDVSRITSGKVDLQRERTCLQDVLAGAVDAASAIMERAGHDLQLEWPQDRIWVDGDAARLTQIVANLLTNAGKYTPNGGRIVLSLRAEGDQALLSVHDTGLGIPPEMIVRIFDMFTQVNHTLERAQGGLGIGLALVRRLVELHGGTIEVASAGADQGSTFTVRLPLAHTSEPIVTKSAVNALPATPRRRRALVVDDNVDAAESLAQLVGAFGSEVRIALSGREALDVAATFQPEIVFLDIGMPEMNGYDAAQRFRQNPQLSEVMLVAVTGWGSEDDRRRSKLAGFDHHHTKPLEAQVVSQLLGAASIG